ncbi:hypothetical protein HYS28_01180 [Candidatus Uhrbacteria bacterium]|nr:hypothetical protein [Candidatus Uhrbacteria bacterium]
MISFRLLLHVWCEGEELPSSHLTREIVLTKSTAKVHGERVVGRDDRPYDVRGRFERVIDQVTDLKLRFQPHGAQEDPHRELNEVSCMLQRVLENDEKDRRKTTEVVITKILVAQVIIHTYSP